MLQYALNRRRFLTLLGGAGAATAVGCAAAREDATAPRNGSSFNENPTNDNAAAIGTDESLPVPSSAESERRRPVDASRRLVVIEMAGGNDGLAMLQPYESGLLQDVRPDLVAADEELVDAGAGFGWHPALAGLVEIGIAGAVGIGSVDPGFSHFEMEQRWWRGVSEGSSRVDTGFFGRICDQLDLGDPVTGLSFAGGPTPALAAEKAVTVGLSDPRSSWFFNQDEPWYNTLRETFGAMSQASADDDDRFAAARAGLADTLRFAESLSEIPDAEVEYPWTDLGQQMRFAAEVLDLEVGVKVMHLRQDGFDTHTGQEWRHRELMTEFNDATVAFVNDLRARNQLDNTLIVTTSEFGRRVPENDSGTDHGGASTLAIVRPGATGVHGEAPDLGKLDDDNVVATARFEDYYATIAEEWFGIAATDVLPAGGTPLTGLL